MAWLEPLSYLLQAQPFNPILWNLYSTCRYLRRYKPTIDVKENIVLDYVKAEDFWMKGSFDTIKDFIAIDDETDAEKEIISDNAAEKTKKPKERLRWPNHPRMAVVGVDVGGAGVKQLYRIPVEWIPRLCVRNGMIVLQPFKFCCREVLQRSVTKLIRCQSLTIPSGFFFDKHFFHVGCGSCDEDNAEVQVFAAMHLYVGLKSILQHLSTGLYVNTQEKLLAVDCNEESLNYYLKSWDEENIIYTQVKKKGTFIRKYLAHIVVCKKCIRYLADFLSLLDQSVEEHPFPRYNELDCDGYNFLGIPIRNYILDADFDMLLAKAYYGVIDGVEIAGCDYVDAFMNTYVIKHG
ncbi:Hypothetical predicted protein [Paramuricea clavata]|uniref:Uncharacterized protein n=1 Tax=Paramuricea clavata TaxID=317549 RepID=A0A7D9D6Y5_PARCT|nr:Hypothetical predicted protein [Paramuricea clavata]